MFNFLFKLLFSSYRPQTRDSLPLPTRPLPLIPPSHSLAPSTPSHYLVLLLLILLASLYFTHIYSLFFSSSFKHHPSHLLHFLLISLFRPPSSPFIHSHAHRSLVRYLVRIFCPHSSHHAMPFIHSYHKSIQLTPLSTRWTPPRPFLCIAQITIHPHQSMLFAPLKSPPATFDWPNPCLSHTLLLSASLPTLALKSPLITSLYKPTGAPAPAKPAHIS